MELPANHRQPDGGDEPWFRFQQTLEKTAFSTYKPLRERLLEGNRCVDNLAMQAGDYGRGEAGSIHKEITENGSLFVVTSSDQDQLLVQPAQVNRREVFTALHALEMTILGTG